MRKLSSFLLIAFGILFLFSSNAFANAHWKRCIRMSFAANKQGTMTNLCNKNLYAIWYDDNGEHSTAIGSSRHLGLGTIHGRFQVHDAYPQSGFDSNSDKRSAHNERASTRASRGAEVSNTVKQNCILTRDHGYIRASNMQAIDPGLASEIRSATDAGFSACMRGGSGTKAYHAVLFRNSSGGTSSSHSSSSGSRGQCGSTQHMCGRECCPD